MHIPELKSPVIVWTKAEKGKMEIAYVGGEVAGYIERTSGFIASRLLGEVFAIRTINSENKTVHHGRVGAMCALDARTVAKRMLHLQIARR